MQITIPTIPIPKGRPRLSRWGTYTPKRTSDYQSVVQDIARKHYKKPLECPVELCIQFIMPIPKTTSKKLLETIVGSPHTKCTGDIDNLCKNLMDSFNGIVFKDDSQVWKLSAIKVYGNEPMSVIEIIPLEELSNRSCE